MKNKILLKQPVIFLLLFLVGTILFTSIILRAQVAPQQPQTQSSNSFTAANKFPDTKLTYKIIDASNKTFGYDIYANERMMIHQAFIEMISGNMTLLPMRGRKKPT